MNYTITRLEKTGDKLFICINSNETPVYVEHFFTQDEQINQQETIDRLVLELEEKSELYVPPEPIISLI